jgi:tRNA pseudouridine55 synthase
MINGILNLNKPRGLTSHDVVDRIRRVAGQRRVGHAGTLDPMATGVLLVCLGRATRVSEYLMASPKLYRARVRLGVTTDTYDAEGAVLEERSVDVSREAVEAALQRFRGHILQVPPMYAALKRGGQPLYKLARQGKTVQRDPRPVEVTRLQLTAWEPPLLTLEVACSPGTYVRSLAHDLGQALGCGAHLAGLVRLASGDFRLGDATPLDDVTPERLGSLIHPIDAALRQYPALCLDETAARRLRSGQSIAAAAPKDGEPSLARAYGPDGAFLAVVVYRPGERLWRPRKVFLPLEE